MRECASVQRAYTKVQEQRDTDAGSPERPLPVHTPRDTGGTTLRNEVG